MQIIHCNGGWCICLCTFNVSPFNSSIPILASRINGVEWVMLRVRRIFIFDPSHLEKYLRTVKFLARNYVVGIVTHYGLDDTGFESREE